ncbi:hypothetical protein Gogos_021240 [Gossypium gossypioides]|uniref:Uncharacterized protein n=1 Tax=Gossypium gossypioides TaxID=34282 RepID=A0A7J9D777_GOSGO|nr:hypothetical protein [Gossypium gossypioides]
MELFVLNVQIQMRLQNMLFGAALRSRRFGNNYNVYMKDNKKLG